MFGVLLFCPIFTMHLSVVPIAVQPLSFVTTVAVQVDFCPGRNDERVPGY
jgi:hypothetical protein